MLFSPLGLGLIWLSFIIQLCNLSTIRPILDEFKPITSKLESIGQRGFCGKGICELSQMPLLGHPMTYMRGLISCDQKWRRPLDFFYALGARSVYGYSG